jgi:acyl-CoA synthetase (AMP-forming)/AMP-acid ligase II
MTIALTRPVSSDEAGLWRAAGCWTDDVLVDTGTFGASPNRPALVDRSGSMTYDELTSAVTRVASALQGLGVALGDTVVVVTDNERQSVVACHAVWSVGAVALLVHKSSGAADIEYACRTSSPSVVLLAPAAQPFRSAAAPYGRGVYAIGDLVNDGAESPSPVAIDTDAARLVIFTSGTLSTPKGVVHTANTLRAATANFRAMMDFRTDERFFLVSPLASIAGVIQALQLAPTLGATVILENAWNESGTLEFLLESGGTFYGGTDTILARLFDSARRQGRGLPLRTVSVGGTMLRRDVLDEAEDHFGIRVLRVYGSSEAPSSTGSLPRESKAVRLSDDGAAMPHVEVRITDDETHEVLLGGPHVFRGYLDPADNLGAFEETWFRTGDAGELRQGRLRVVGRLKEIASRDGRKISLIEVEEAFGAVTEVESCAAFCVADNATGEHVSIAVRLADHQSLDVPAALDAMLAAGMAKWKLPESVLLYSSPLPMTATGKVRRSELREDDGAMLWRAPRLEEGPART